MQVLTWDVIAKNLEETDLIALQEKGFVAYSTGQVAMTPVGHLDFPEDHGECHIKSGYIKGDPFFVVKAATTFFENSKKGLSSGNGLMILCSAKTGVPEFLLRDEGRLTDLRTALAGAIAAKYLAPSKVHRIGIVGTGIQARLQLLHLKNQTTCRKVMVWGRSVAKLEEYRRSMENTGFHIELTTRTEDIAGNCNLIVTTTASREPLLRVEQIQPGTHITAVGADSPGKQELDAALFSKADIRAVDSVEQCLRFGDAQHAYARNLIKPDDLIELGQIIAKPSLGRRNDEQITLADLTGLAVQDVQIAKAAAL